METERFQLVMGSGRGSDRPAAPEEPAPAVGARPSLLGVGTANIVAALSAAEDTKLAVARFAAVWLKDRRAPRLGRMRPTLQEALQDARGFLDADLALVVFRAEDALMLLDSTGLLVHRQPL